jgi:hypothetical protein
MRTPEDAGAYLDADAEPVKLSVNVSSDIGQRLRRVAFDERLSESSIVQIALKLMFARTTDETIGSFLREQGASLRRGLK